MIKASKCIAVIAVTAVFAGTMSTLAQRQAAGPTAQRPQVPQVTLSNAHEALCKVKVGDTLPDFTLPPLTGGEATKTSSLYGDKATVVVFWSGDRRMAREQLADMGPEVVEPFGNLGVAVVGIAVGPAAGMLKAAKSDFPNLLDVDGKAFAQVGSEKLPRTYLLDPNGKIVWFDIEYSLGTRRELQQALRAIAGDPTPGR